MEKQPSSKMLCNTLVAGAAALALLASSTLYARSGPQHRTSEPNAPYSIYPDSISSQPSPDNLSPMPRYQDNKPQPLMQGEGFNYDLYYNYHLTPHIVLRPNLQQTTKPGSVEDNSQRFVGGLSAGIKF